MPELAALQAIVHGYVQGVAFRAFVSIKAANLGVTGYVRNIAGGKVEVAAEGEKERLLALLQHLKQGPPTARVERVETRWSNYTGKYARFRIVY